MKQLESVKRNYFTPDFAAAYKKLKAIPEVHKRAVVSSQVNSVMKNFPALKPNQKTYEKYLKEHKQWTKERNEYYNHSRKSPEVTKKDLKSFASVCKEKEQNAKEQEGKRGELKALQEYMLCLLLVSIPDDLIGKIDLRTIQLRKEGTSRNQNYITRNKIYIGQYKAGGVYGQNKVIQIESPKQIHRVLNRMRSIKDELYVFGGDSPLSQPAFSQMIKRVFGQTLMVVRKMVKHEKTADFLKDFYQKA